MKDEQRPEGHVGDVGPVEDFKVTVPPVGVILAISKVLSCVNSSTLDPQYFTKLK